MKILSVYCKNINSLAGETRINFDQPPFIDGGVFAITGVNGAGKTSILDAITLGLYGQTPRTQTLTGHIAAHVMTRHTHECYAQVEFALQNTRYRSTWQVLRDKETFLPAQMQLTRLSDGVVLADNAAQANVQMSELTGMNYRHFTRAMLLAQGEFAAFLHALDNERLDILETLVGADSYTQHKAQVLHEAEQVSEQLAQLQAQLNTIELLSPEKRASYNADLADFQDRIDSLQRQQASLRQQHDSLKATIGLQTQLKQQEQKCKVAQTLALGARGQLESLLVDEDALSFAAQLHASEQQASQVQHSQTALNALQHDLQHLQTQLTQAMVVNDVNFSELNLAEQQRAISQARIELATVSANRQAENSLWQSLAIQLSEKKASVKLTQTWLEDNASASALLTVFPSTDKLKALRSQISQYTQQQAELEQAQTLTNAALKKNQDALQVVQNKASELTALQQSQQLALENILQNNTLEELTHLQTEQKQRVSDFETLVQLALAHEKLMGGGGFRLFKRKPVETEQVDTAQLTAQLEQLHLDIRREENIKRVLETAIFRETLTKKLATHRQHLIEDEPCHLCGAVQHPYVYQPPLITNSQQALVDQQAKLRHLVSAANSLRVRIKQSQQLSTSKQTNSQQAIQLSAEWLILLNRLNIARGDLKIHHTSLMKSLLAEQTQELKTINSLLSDCQRRHHAIEKTHTSLRKNAALISQYQTDISQLETVQQQRSEQQAQIATHLEELQRSVQTQVEQLSAELEPLGETLPPQGAEDALLTKLNSRRADYENHQARLASLHTELDLLQRKQATCQAEMAQYDSQFAHLTANVQREESIGLRLAVLEKQKAIIAQENLLNEQRNASAALERDLQNQLANSRFSQIIPLKEALKRLEQLPSLQRRVAELDADLTQKTNQLALLEGKLATAQTDTDLVGLDFDSLNAQLRSVNQQLDINKQEWQRVSALLQQASQTEQHYTRLQNDYEQQSAQALELLTQAEQLRAESPLLQRRRMQQRLISQLLTKTNANLEKISGRYYLRQQTSEQGLALLIEDSYQAGQGREVKTLSGGESFVISLALALGLSELAGNGKTLDSLFLDEGFGHLDAETLYMVISTLEALHTQGKMVGVISHVEAVQQRFKTQLQLLKKADGLSELKLIA